MSYEHNGNSTRNRQSSLAENVTNEGEKKHQEQNAKKLKKYRKLSIVLVCVIVVSCFLLITQENTASSEMIEITADNWSSYFVISKEIIDTSIVLGDTGLYSMETNYIIRLKDHYVKYLDAANTSKVSFSLTHEECMGLFEMDYKNLTYKEPSSFSAIKNCTANVVLKYPQATDDQSNIIYSATILGGGEADDNTGLGFIGRNFDVTAASGILYLMSDYK